MPKEYINDRYLIPNQLTGEGPQPDDMACVQVGWSRGGGDVQVSVIDAAGEGLTVHLGEVETARLRRVLRRARTQAFDV